ncbi:MAG: RNA polymerase subunit sigma [Sphingopyxis sp.]|nr:MAG: RNA polymerase subunit sigma [Sphingopyxis sp.]
MGLTQNTQVLLHRWQEGEDAARDLLIARLHPELSQIAAAKLRGERNSSLSTGDLVNEAVIKFLGSTGESPNNRAHFVALAARMMRNILADHARSKGRAKRRHHKVELCTRVEGGKRFDLHLLESALVRLGVIDAEMMELVEMRYFGGMTIADISEVTGWSEPTLKRRWHTARVWLADALANPIDDV